MQMKNQVVLNTYTITIEPEGENAEQCIFSIVVQATCMRDALGKVCAIPDLPHPAPLEEKTAHKRSFPSGEYIGEFTY